MRVFITVAAILLTTSTIAANVADLQQGDNDLQRPSLLLTRRHHHKGDKKQHSRLNKDRTIIGSHDKEDDMKTEFDGKRTKRHHDDDEDDVVEGVEETQQESIAQHSIKEGIAGGIIKEMKEMDTNNKDEEISPTTSDMPTLSPTWIDDSTLSPTDSDEETSSIKRNQDMHYSIIISDDDEAIEGICRDDSGTSYLQELAVEIQSVQEKLVNNEGLNVSELRNYEDLLDTLLLLKTDITENIDILCPSTIDFVLDAPEEKCGKTSFNELFTAYTNLYSLNYTFSVLLSLFSEE